jgi:hydroxymethylbilane synthase
MKLKLGTRGSDLARAQSTMVAESLAEAGIECELTIISTAGDRSMAPSFASIGSQGVFVREIEQALIDGEVDIAVHSYKDLPTHSPDQLVVAASPSRIDVADFMLVHKKMLLRRTDQILPLAEKARIGTSSARRAAWIRHFRPDLEVLPLRGNVPTRVKRFNDGDFEAILLAGAGVRRLEIGGNEPIKELLDSIRMVRLDPEVFVPAPAQGALAIQCRRDATRIAEALAAIDDPVTRRSIAIERDALARAEGGCDAAFGALCRPITAGPRHSVGGTGRPPVENPGYELFIMAPRNGRVLTTRVTGPKPEPLAEQAWEMHLVGESGEVIQRGLKPL